MKVKIATVTSAGFISGKMIRTKMPYTDAPSIFAASSRSRGMPRMNWTSRKTKKAPPPKKCGKMSGT